VRSAAAAGGSARRSPSSSSSSSSRPNVAHLYTSAREASAYEAELRAREEALLQLRREQTAAIRAGRSS
jgi:hypothetical protein